MSLLLLTLLAASDAPRLVPEETRTVDLEALHFEVRQLDAQLLALPERMPLGYVFGSVLGGLTALGLLPLAVAHTVTLVQYPVSPPVNFYSIGAFTLGTAGIAVGVGLLVHGLNLLAQAKRDRPELTRKRDDALLRLERAQATGR